MEVFGKIRVSASAKQKYILSNNCYNEVFRLFCINNMQLLKLFGTVVKQNEKLIADLFIRAFSNKGSHMLNRSSEYLQLCQFAHS